MDDNQIRKELNYIEIPKELSERIMDGFMQAEKEMEGQAIKKKMNYKKKLWFCFSAAVVFIGLFIGSTFISPAMASIASKIPLFNTVFNRGLITDVLFEHLKEQGFAVNGMSQSDNKITITIDSNQYSIQKKEVKQEAEQYIQQQGYSFEIAVIKDNGSIIIEDPKAHALANKDFIIEISTKLDEAGFNTLYNSYRTKPEPAELTLVIPESDYETRKSEIISIVQKVSEHFEVGDYKLSFETFSLDERERSTRWSDIISTINEVLLNHEGFSISSFSFDIKDNVDLYVQLNLPAEDSRTREKVKEIEQEIHKFLSSDEIKNIIKDDHYKIEITSKDGEILN